MANFDTESYRGDLDKIRQKFKSHYNARMPVLNNYEQVINSNLSELLGSTMPTVADMMTQAGELGDRYNEDFAPAMSRYLQSAEGYDTPERRASASGRAMSDVMTAGEKARDAAISNLESYGIDPSMTRSAALDQDLRVQSALEAVRQGNEAALGVEERGRAYVSDALDKGQQLLQGQTSLAGTASNIALGTQSAANQTAQVGSHLFDTQTANLGSQAGLVQANEQMKLEEANFKQAKSNAKSASTMAGLGGLGQLAGVAGGATLGYFASGGNPMGALYGAQAGGAATSGMFAQ